MNWKCPRRKSLTLACYARPLQRRFTCQSSPRTNGQGTKARETLMNLEAEEERPGVAEVEYHSSLSVE